MPEPAMSTEENKALVRREQEELWNHTGNLDAAHELFAPGQAEAARQEAADFRQGFPDVVSVIENLIAEGDMVAARWSSRATHLGEYAGVSPTGNEVEFTGISVYRIAGGRIAESWRSEEHTSELQSRQYIECCLLLVKKPQSLCLSSLLRHR